MRIYYFEDKLKFPLVRSFEFEPSVNLYPSGKTILPFISLLAVTANSTVFSPVCSHETEIFPQGALCHAEAF